MIDIITFHLHDDKEGIKKIKVLNKKDLKPENIKSFEKVVLWLDNMNFKILQ